MDSHGDRRDLRTDAARGPIPSANVAGTVRSGDGARSEGPATRLRVAPSGRRQGRRADRAAVSSRPQPGASPRRGRTAHRPGRVRRQAGGNRGLVEKGAGCGTRPRPGRYDRQIPQKAGHPGRPGPPRRPRRRLVGNWPLRQHGREGLQHRVRSRERVRSAGRAPGQARPGPLAEVFFRQPQRPGRSEQGPGRWDGEGEGTGDRGLRGGRISFARGAIRAYSNGQRQRAEDLGQRQACRQARNLPRRHGV